MVIKSHYYHLFVVGEDMDKLELFEGDLPVQEITNRWYDEFRNSNYGAIITFVGVVRDEDGIDGLSFDIYEPILNSWLNSWQQKANEKIGRA